jgi:hypothetical protein
MAAATEIQDRSKTLFWKDRWLLGRHIEDIAMCIFAMIPKGSSNRLWKGLEIPVHPNVIALFKTAIESQVGKGNTSLHWSDKWLLGAALLILHLQ